MTERSDAFGEAVNTLLRLRLEVKAQLGQVDGALVALGVDPKTLDADDTDPATAFAERSKAVHTGSTSRSTEVLPDSGADFMLNGDAVEVKVSRPSVRSLVQQILDANDVWYSTADLTKEIRQRMGDDDRGVDKIKSNVRSSLWSLRKQGSVVANDHNYKASKWHTDTDAASTRETASGSNPARKEGGGVDEDSVRDLHPLWEAGDQDHGLDASVEASHP